MNTTATEKQIAANQRNAKKSTGPKTTEGRAIVRKNALKHGIRSRNVVVEGFSLHENKREYTNFRHRFHEELNPVGPLEEMLVDSIVATQWRLYRVLRAESGEIALSVDTGSRKRVKDDNFVGDFLLWNEVLDPVTTMKKSARGLFVLRNYLSGVLSVFEGQGSVSKKMIDTMMIGGKPNAYSRELESFHAQFEKSPAYRGSDAALQKQVKEYLTHEIDLLSDRYDEAMKQEEIGEGSRRAAETLPSMDVLEKIMRYETRLERQLYRAMNQLERLQRMRNGEAVPPPLRVDLSDRS
ncbi:MAG: hypothetical protein WCD79_07600 [Chthoniobacteraceae bacterium]